VVFFVDPPSFEYFSVRIKPVNIPRTIEFLKSKWEKLVPGEPFNYTFIDEDYNRLYQSENRIGKIFIIATCLTLFISCLGLFGLAAFTTEQRSKEIGIRKVMGASAPEIIYMLSKEFSLWVLLANIFAWPIAWYGISRWLENFAYRIKILPWPFFLAGLIALIIALISVSYKAVRAALANPVEALRYE
jgi:putative ABC transport system permease protein